MLQNLLRNFSSEIFETFFSTSRNFLYELSLIKSLLALPLCADARTFPNQRLSLSLQFETLKPEGWGSPAGFSDSSPSSEMTAVGSYDRSFMDDPSFIGAQWDFFQQMHPGVIPPANLLNLPHEVIDLLTSTSFSLSQPDNFIIKMKV